MVDLFENINGIYHRIGFKPELSPASREFFRQGLVSFMAYATMKKKECIPEVAEAAALKQEKEEFPETGIAHDYTLIPVSLHQYHADMFFHGKALQYLRQNEIANIQDMNHYLISHIAPEDFPPSVFENSQATYSPELSCMIENEIKPPDRFQLLTMNGFTANSALLNILNMARLSQYAQCTPKQQAVLLEQVKGINMAFNTAKDILKGPYSKILDIPAAQRPKAQDLPPVMAKIVMTLAQDAYNLGTPTNAHSFLVWKRTEGALEEMQASTFYAKECPKAGASRFIDFFIHHNKTWKAYKNLPQDKYAELHENAGALMREQNENSAITFQTICRDIQDNAQPIYAA